MIRLLAAVCLLAAHAAWAQHSPALQKQAQGGEAYNRGDYAAAMVALNEAIHLDSSLPGPYLLRCATRFQMGGMNREALDDCNEAIRLNPDYADAYYQRGVILDQNYGDSQKAIQDFNATIRLRPSYALAWFKRGNAKARANDLQGALSDYNEAIRLNGKSAVAYFNRGVVFYKLGNRSASIADLQQAQTLYDATGDQAGAKRSASAMREIRGAR